MKNSQDSAIQERLGNVEKMLSKIYAEQKGVFEQKQAAEFLGISESYLYKLTHQGQISYSRPGGKKIYFLKSDLMEYIRRNKIKALNLAKIQSEAATHVALS